MSKVTSKSNPKLKEPEIVSDSDSDTESEPETVEDTNADSNAESDSNTESETETTTEPKVEMTITKTSKPAPDSDDDESDDDESDDDESDDESEDDESDSEDEDEPKTAPEPSKKSSSKSSSKTFTNFNYDKNVMTVDINDPEDKYHTTLINAIRRIIIAELPNFSIHYEGIKFHENTTILHNDMLAQRLCLLPLKYQTFIKHNTDVEITYNKSNTTEDMMEIYSGDFTATSKGAPLSITEVFTSPDFLFSKMKPEQTLNFTATISKSTPRQSGAHMMMTSTSTYWFKHDTAKLDKIMSSLSPDDPKETIKTKIRSVYDSDAIELLIDTIDEDEDHDIIRSQLEDLIYLKNSADNPLTYVFKIKDLNALKAPQIFKMAVETLIVKLENLVRATKMNDTSKLEIFESKTNIGAYQFDIGHEDFTLSYLIQHYFLQDPEYDYVGTIKPSPMKDMFILRTHTLKDNTKERNVEKFIENLEKIIAVVKQFQSEIKF